MAGFVIFIFVAALAIYLFSRDGNGEPVFPSRKSNPVDPTDLHHSDFGANSGSAEFHHHHHSNHAHGHADFNAGSSSDSITDFGSDSSFDSGSDFGGGSDSTSFD